MSRTHYLDDVVEELAAWMKSLEDYGVEMLMDDGRAPFAANVTNQQALEYYTRQFFNDDGSPNVAGRTDEFQRLGHAGYVKAMSAVLKSRGTLGVPERAEDTGGPPPEVSRNPAVLAAYQQMTGGAPGPAGAPAPSPSPPPPGPPGMPPEVARNPEVAAAYQRITQGR